MGGATFPGQRPRGLPQFTAAADGGIRRLPDDERSMIFGGTAARVYGISTIPLIHNVNQRQARREPPTFSMMIVFRAESSDRPVCPHVWRRSTLGAVQSDVLQAAAQFRTASRPRLQSRLSAEPGPGRPA